MRDIDEFLFAVTFGGLIFIMGLTVTLPLLNMVIYAKIARTVLIGLLGGLMMVMGLAFILVGPAEYAYEKIKNK